MHASANPKAINAPAIIFLRIFLTSIHGFFGVDEAEHDGRNARQNDRHQKEENGNDDEKKGERVCIDKVYK